MLHYRSWASVGLAALLLASLAWAAPPDGKGKPPKDPPPDPPTIDYSMTVLPTLGGSSSSTLGMNSHGDVVGFSSRTAGGGDYAFLYSGGVMIDLTERPGVEEWRLLYASDINDNGQIVGGGFLDGAPPYRAYRLTLGDGQTIPDIVEDLGFFPDGTYAEPEAINNAGEVVGAADTIPLVEQVGFLWTEDGGMVEITATNRAESINDAGQVTGVMYVDGIARAFRYTPGSEIEDLGAIKKPRGGSPWSRGNDINNLGEVVGYCSAGRNTHAFLYTNEISDVGVLEGDDESERPANNDLGDIVGISSPRDIFFPRAFLSTQGFMLDLFTLVIDPPLDLESNFLVPADINNFGDICGSTYIVSGTAAHRRSFILTLVPSED